MPWWGSIATTVASLLAKLIVYVIEKPGVDEAHRRQVREELVAVMTRLGGGGDGGRGQDQKA